MVNVPCKHTVIQMWSPVAKARVGKKNSARPKAGRWYKNWRGKVGTLEQTVQRHSGNHSDECQSNGHNLCLL